MVRMMEVVNCLVWLLEREPEGLMKIVEDSSGMVRADG